MSKMTPLSPVIKRYTTLSNALDVLLHERLTLLNPNSWDDSNDAHFVNLYRQHKGAGSVLALCCTMAAETYHHWRIFSPGTEGVCLEFHRVALQKALRPVTSRAGRVEYVTLEDMEGGTFEPRQLPLLKRWGFSDEREWRVLLCVPDTEVKAYSVPIPLQTIKRVIVSPWAPPLLFRTIESVIQGLPGCSEIKATRSSLISNDRWKAAGDALFALSNPAT